MSSVSVFVLGAEPLPQPIDLEASNLSEGEEATFQWGILNAGMWYQIYLQRDGALYTSAWIRGDYAG